MVGRRKVVFLIDVKPSVSESLSFSFENTAKLVRFSVLRLLTYFDGLHRSIGGKSDTGPLWGFKFYKSSGGQLEYGNHHFYDLKLKHFETFEEELEQKLLRAKGESVCRSRSRTAVADQLSCALAEVVTGFQWERPDFFSPVKANRSTRNKNENSFKGDDTTSNFVFLFTPCPSCCGDVKYFSDGEPLNLCDLKSAIVKEEVYTKMTVNNKIAFHWIDMVSGRQTKMQDNFHRVLSEMMSGFSGSLIPIENLSYWWVEGVNTTVQKASQPGPFRMVMDNMLSTNSYEFANACHSNFSLNVYRVLISLKDSCSVIMVPSEKQFMPIILRNVLARRKSCNIESSMENVAEPRTPKKVSRMDDCADVSNTLSSSENDTTIAEIEGVFKSSAAIMLLHNCMESYYCSIDYSQEQGEDKRNLIAAFKGLLSILKTKHLILVLSMHHPEVGKKVSACLQPWTATSGVLTILSSPVQLEFWKEDRTRDTTEQQKALVEGLIHSVHSKIAKERSLESTEGTSSVSDVLSAMKEQTSMPKGSSFMQVFNYWFLGLPSHSLPSQLHQNIERIQGVEPEKIQRANKASTNLFKKLKESYRSKRHTEDKEKEIPVQKQTASAVMKLKSRTLSRSEHMIAKSKANTMKKKSEEEIKGRERNFSNQESEASYLKGPDEAREVDEDVLKEIDLIQNDFSTMDIDEFYGYVKDQINDALAKDMGACEAIVRRLSRASFSFMMKHNESKDATERTSPDQFLEGVFNNPEMGNDVKQVKVARHIIRVLMDLEMAALQKLIKEDRANDGTDPKVGKTPQTDDAGTGDNERIRDKSDGKETDQSRSEDDSSDEGEEEELCPTAERVIGQLRPLIFLENPGFLAKYLNGTILPRFKTKIPKILRDVYEGLGHQTPLEILTPSKKAPNADDSSDVAEEDFPSLSSGSYGSTQASNQSGTNFRRFSSINDSMATKRQIMVPPKASNKNKHKRTKKGYQDNRPVVNKEGWCRNLFDTGSNENDSLATVSGCRKRKLQRRYSEFAPSVKDTPAGKQRRHFFWKKQHKQRKKTDCPTNVTVIEESPLKDCSIEESPIKSASSATRFFSRSQSFSCKTSPRRFYAPRRNLPGTSSSSRSKFGRSISCLTSDYQVVASEHEVEGDVTDEVQHSSVVPRERSQSWCRITTPDKSTHSEQTFVCSPFKDVPERTRSTDVNEQTTRTMRSLSMDTSPLPAMNLTPTKENTGSVAIAVEPNDWRSHKPKRVLDLLEIASAKESFGFDSRLSSRPLMYSEDSMDWVAMLENDKADTESAESTDQSPSRTIESVPSVRNSECGSIKDTSPSIFTPVRDGKQPFSSPFLSASSLETLENAPILSPRLRGSRSKRELSCRKRIEIPIED